MALPVRSVKRFCTHLAEMLIGLIEQPHDVKLAIEEKRIGCGLSPHSIPSSSLAKLLKFSWAVFLGGS
jgi:hypothetical protein